MLHTREEQRIFLAAMALNSEIRRISVRKKDGSDDTMAWDNSEAQECADRCVMFADAILDKINPMPNLELEKQMEDARDIELEQRRPPLNNEENPV
jgi:hypothetical protein